MLASTAPTPFLQLCNHVRARRTGEFVFSATGSEIHIFLLSGRIAWATTARQPLEFIRYLIQQKGIDSATLRHVVETCRRERLPLGNTLVEWNIASLDDVREALAVQFRNSLDALRNETSGSSVFLDRPNFRGYDERLTFDISSLLEAAAAPSEEEPPRDLAPNPVEAEIARVAQKASWIAVENGAASRDSRVPLPLFELLRHGTEFVARRKPDGGEIGFVTSDGSCVFVGFEQDHYGLLLLSLTPFIPIEVRPTVVELPRYEPIEDSARVDAHHAPIVEQLREIIEFGPSLHGVALLDQNRQPIFSLDRSRNPGESLKRIADRPALTDALQTTGTRLAVAEGSHWLFGVALEDFASTAWVLLDRNAPQSLGWAALSSALGTSTKKKFGKKPT